MTSERLQTGDAPKENFDKGLYSVEIPTLGEKYSGKVRDSWRFQKNGEKLRVIVTTDRQSAYDRVICTVPGKGQVLNLISAYWFEKTKDIIENHVIETAHPNVLICKNAKENIGIEVVLRRYMAKSSTSTSVYHNYASLNRWEIYGIKFPEGLRPNEEFPMGTVLTPTTKAMEGHDEELTDDQAAEMVDSKFGDGIWDKAKKASFEIFERAGKECLEKGLILVDTKFEFGIDENGNLMIIDEILTPDSSRNWLLETYTEKFDKGETPETFDKEILRRWLAEQGFKGDGPVPVVDPKIIDQMSHAYTVPYKMITGKDLPDSYLPSGQSISDPDYIREKTLNYLVNSYISTPNGKR